MTDHASVVTDYITAVGQGRLDDLDPLLDPDMTFQRPGRPRLDGRAAYVGALRRLRPIISRNDIRRVFVDGDEACVIYDFVTDTAVGAIPTVEWLGLRDGRISSVLLIFEDGHWPEVLADLESRAATAAA
jgi:ketosteroid isomerase-like protein